MNIVGKQVDVLDRISFLDLIEAKTPGDSHLGMCIQCGTCGGSCPSGADMQHTPRQIFALIRAGDKNEVFNSNTPWYCVSCYLCTVRCPQEVQITDLMYTLKGMAIEAGAAVVDSAVDFSQSFIGHVENNGRSFEFGLASRHAIRHRPTSMVGAAGIGLGLLSKGRMDMTPHKIEGIDQLKLILRRAKELAEEE